jgi:methylmalonyl-CoA/ethylmalonyl-CoA epimerase
MPKLNFFGEDAKFHHVGIAVPEFPESFDNEPRWTDSIQKVHVSFGEINTLPIELISPAQENSPIDESIKKNVRLVHLCFEVPNLDSSIAIAKKQGFYQVASPKPAVAFDNNKIVWLYHKVFGLFELVESES